MIAYVINKTNLLYLLHHIYPQILFDGKTHTYHLRSTGLSTHIQEIIRKSDVTFDIELPMIAVVGSQSTGTIISHAGKSSLLEAIIGR